MNAKAIITIAITALFITASTLVCAADVTQAAPTVSGQADARFGYERIVGVGRADYLLSHAGIVSGTEIVILNGKPLQRSRDYFIDYDSGSIVFLEPLEQTDYASISYKFIPVGAGERTVSSMPSLGLISTDRASMNFSYVRRVQTDASGTPIMDTFTYGLNSTYMLGSSALSSTIFFSNPQPRSSSGRSAQNTDIGAFIMQQGKFSLGALKLNIGYQSIDKGFNGFQALQESGAVASDLANQLAKEKGLRRFDLGADYSMPKGLSLKFASNSVSDSAGGITTNSIGLTTPRLRINFNSSDVDKNFTRAKDLRDPNRDQLAKEVGMKRTNLLFELAPFRSNTGTSWNKISINSISEASGSIDAQSASIGLGALSLGFTHRSISAGFKRMASLSKDDLTDIALDIRRQFDPNASASQITDADRQQAASSVGLDRTNFIAGLSLGTDRRADVQSLSISDGKGSIERSSAKISGKNFGLSIMSQNISPNFGMLGSMTAVEKAQFGNERGMDRLGFTGSLKSGFGALGINLTKVTDNSSGSNFTRQSFDFTGSSFALSAKFQDVGSKFTRGGDLAESDRAELQKQRGMSRSEIAGSVKSAPGKLNFSTLKVTSDDGGSYLRQTFGLTGNSFTLSANFLNISPRFTRAMDLPDANKKEIAQQVGLRRADFTGSLKTGLGAVGLGFSRISDQNGADVSKESFSLASSKVNLNINHQNVDAGFNRAADLPDADKQRIADERGFDRTDITAAFNIMPGLALESFYYGAKNAAEQIARKQMRNRLTLAMPSGGKLTALRDDLSVAARINPNSGYEHEVYTLDQRIGMLGGLALTGLRDVNRKKAADGSDITTSLTKMHLESDKKRPIWGFVDNKVFNSGDGKFERAQTFGIASKPNSRLGFSSSISHIERETGLENTTVYGLQYDISNRLKFSADSTDTRASVGGGSSKRNISLSSTIAEDFLGLRNIKVAANLNTEMKNDKPVKDTKSLSLETEIPNLAFLKGLKLSVNRGFDSGGNAGLKDASGFKLESSPFNVSFLKNAKLMFSSSSEDKNGKPVKFARDMKIESSLFGGSFIAQLAEQLDASGKRPEYRLLSYSSDKSAGRRLTYDVLYKWKDPGSGKILPVRRYNAAWKISTKTSFALNYLSYQEQNNGVSLPTAAATASLTTSLSGYACSISYKQDTNYANHTNRAVYGLSLAGKTNGNAAVEVGCSVDASTIAGADGRGITYRVKYDKQVNADHYITLATEYSSTDTASSNSRHDLRANIDLRRVFN